MTEAPAKQRASREPDRRLKEDIRLLGRLLGDTIRQQAGQEMFDLVERIRQTAVQYRREQDPGTRKALEKTIGALDGEQATHVVRAFSYFHHLANIAEDRYRAQEAREPGRASATAPEEGSLPLALSRLKAAGIPSRQVVSLLERARIEPVLTAHPTEVQRKSILERHHAISLCLETLANRQGAGAGHGRG